MRTNIVGTHWLCVTWYCSMHASAVFGIELLHHDRGAAEAHRAHAVEERRRVVQRRGREVDGVARPCPRPSVIIPISSGCVADELAGDLVAHALGPAGRARRVEHPRALELLLERLGRDSGRASSSYGVVAVDRSPPTMRRSFTLGILSRSSVGDVAERVGDHEHLRVAVVEDVRGLVGVEVPVDARVVEAGALRGPAHLEELGAGSPSTPRCGRRSAARRRRSTARAGSSGRSARGR